MPALAWMMLPSALTFAEAIAARDELEGQLTAACTAVEEARARKWAAQDRLDALRAKNAEESASQSLDTMFISSVLARQPCGVDTLERPSTFDKDESALEREIATWQETQAECEAEIPALESALNFAEWRVDDAAREALKASDVVATLLDGLDELHNEIDKRLSALAYLRHRNLISEADMTAALAAIRRFLLGEHHPVVAEWATAFRKLVRDADAALPQ